MNINAIRLLKNLDKGLKNENLEKNKNVGIGGLTSSLIPKK